MLGVPGSEEPPGVEPDELAADGEQPAKAKMEAERRNKIFVFFITATIYWKKEKIQNAFYI